MIQSRTPAAPARSCAGRADRVLRACAASVLAAAPLLAEAQPGWAQSAFPASRLRPSGYTGSPGHSARPPAGYGAPEGFAEPPPMGERVRVDLAGGGHGRTRTLSLPRGKSAVIELPMDAKDVLVSDPKVADVVLSTPRRIYVMGMGSGQTDAAFFDAAGRELLRLEIRVDQDVSAVGQTLARIMPGSGVHVDAVNQNIILSGEVANAAEADKAVRIASSFVGKPEQVLNMLSIRGGEQVMLKVKIVEMNRTVIKQLGFNIQAALNQLGKAQVLLGITPTYAINGRLLGGGQAGLNYLNRDTQATALIQAFERTGLIRTLAEPNLTAISGESAKFLAGGEFPVPVGLDNNGRVTVEFKPFGVGLGFTPVVLSNGKISLKLSTEVSEITSIGGFTLNNGPTSSGAAPLAIPGLTVRRAESTVELPSGGSLMLAGLLQAQTKQNLDALPGLGQVPILGTLLRSRDFQNNETELVIIVTPYLVNPVSPGQLQTPADGLQIADDLSTNLLGRLNSGFAKPGAPLATTPAPSVRTYQGPYGYVVE